MGLLKSLAGTFSLLVNYSLVQDLQVKVFWVVTLCGVAIRQQCFRGSCCLHLQGEVHGAGKWT